MIFRLCTHCEEVAGQGDVIKELAQRKLRSAWHRGPLCRSGPRGLWRKRPPWL